MAEKIHVMIVDDVPETRNQLRKLLSFDPDIEVVDLVGSGEEAIERVTDVMPDVILMDINLPGIDGIATTGKILELVPTAQVIMLSVQEESGYMRKAMMAGARDYLAKPPSADELLDAIHRAFKMRQKMVTGPLSSMVGTPAPTTAEPGKRGKVITVFSPKGGTGCTTIAVNLAVALQSMPGSNGKVLIVDENLQFGDVNIFMKLQPSRTLADLAPHAFELDVDLVNNILVSHKSGVQLLAAPPSPEDAELFYGSDVDEETGANAPMKSILSFAKEQFDYIVIDTAHLVDSVFLAAFDLSDLVLVLTRPVIPEIRGARLFLELLQKMEYPLDEQVGLIINSVDNKRMGIQPEAIERAMMPALAHIPLDERSALRAANYGVPIITQNAKSPIGQAMLNLAELVHERLSEVEEKEEQEKRAGRGRLL